MIRLEDPMSQSPHWRMPILSSLPVVLLLQSTFGCTENASASAPNTPAAPKAERITRSAGNKLIADVTNDVVTIQLVEETQCEWVVRSREGGYAKESGWKTCSSSPIEGTSIKFQTGGSSIVGTSNASGKVSFDLNRLSGVSSRPSLGFVSIATQGVTAQSTSVSLADTPFYLSWSKMKDVEDATRLQIEKEQEAADRAEADRKNFEGLLDKSEKSLARLRPGTWTPDDLTEFDEMVASMESAKALMASRVQVPEADQIRYGTIDRKVQRSMSLLSASAGAARARQREREVAELARDCEAILAALPANNWSERDMLTFETLVTKSQRLKTLAEANTRKSNASMERLRAIAVGVGDLTPVYQEALDAKAARIADARRTRARSAPSAPPEMQLLVDDFRTIPQLANKCSAGSNTACALMNWLSKCSNGISTGCDSVGTGYLGGVFGQRDTNRTRAYWLAACRLDGSRCIKYGLAFSNNAAGLARDPNTAEQFYDAACNNNPDQCALVGIMYRRGQGAIQDPTKARAYLERGCQAGSAASCAQMRQ